MPATYDPATLLKYANLQMAAEAFLFDEESSQIVSGSAYVDALKNGNNRASKFPNELATQFSEEWTVIAQQPNTTTGFSGT